jgi:hypothetical protein
VPSHRRGQADGRGQFRVARIAEHALTVQDHDRRVLRTDAELLEQRFRVSVVLEVQPPGGQPVACREVAQPARVRRVPRANDPQPDAQPNKQRATDKVSAQDQVPERRVASHEFAKPVNRYGQHRRLGERHGTVIGGLASQQAQLAKEPARAVHADDPVAGHAVGLDDRHRSA